MLKKCSVILSTFNRIDYLKKSIPALLSLDYSDYEIIVVNDGSSDATKNYLDSFKNNPKVRVFHNEKNLGLSFSRNIGIRQASYEVVAFTDDDCLVDKNWLNFLLKGFKDENVGFVIGQTFYVAKNYKGYFPERLVQNIGAKWPMGCNIAYKKNVFERFGYFEDKFFRFGNEDSEMAIRVVSKGLTFTREVEALVYHQMMDWQASQLLRSAHNFSVWPLLKKIYPNYYLCFEPKIKSGFIVDARDYLYFLFLPILLPVLLVRYFLHGKRDLKIFFTKWPVYLFLKRYYIYREAIRQRVFMI
jgi:glycosyltransferase involved in cell wall biosynthesis